MKVNKWISTKAAAIAVAACVSGPVAADPIITWDWVLNAGWTNGVLQGGGAPTPATPVDIDPTNPGNEGDAQISWGTSTGQGQSSLVINNPNLSSPNVDGVGPQGEGEVVLVDQGDGTWSSGFVAGTSITHNNFPITGNSLVSVALTEWFTLAPDGDNVLPQGTFLDTPEFDILFVETPNSTPCGFPSTSVCDDIFVVLNPVLLNQSFQVGNYLYNIEIQQTGLTPLSPQVCDVVAPELGGQCVGFQTVEGESSTGQFGFVLTAREISEPAMLGLFGLGLLGLGYGRRRARR
ncbi:THxN family PEP-CTERM protein [Parahaliea mediterranea]|uniref:THxN family PEP-CTERM protein n=1 Tax=Parahaliea mediterranea TaxID=651086 RepID=A0A939IMF8_9GAMM|nr:THxN family PEP-CTERM protein [Parahaliea mediterranea]MBN7797475.1 THxN family PEP-CTERM protein [Parahaliea mediterranea]